MTGSIIRDVEALDIRFPTSKNLDGSDAMNANPDYSLAYVTIRTSSGAEGYGFTFTIGRGTEVVVSAIDSLKPLIIGMEVERLMSDLGSFWRTVVGDSQLRWLGPEKGVIHLATAALVNAVWDLAARAAGKPLWRFVVDMEPDELVSCIDFRGIIDVLHPRDARDILIDGRKGISERLRYLEERGYPAYTTSAGWLGYGDEKLRELCRAGVAAGWNHFKQKVGRDIVDDQRRADIIRQEIGPDRTLMMDANQVWEVDQAIENMRLLSRFDPWWIEEPISPDDVLGHARIAKAIRPVGVATGEHAHNRIVFKQLLQAEAVSVIQPDSCRLGGVNEVLAVLLMAAKFGVPVCMHAGGVGLCEYTQHLAAIDYLTISARLDDRVLEYVDHLHEHFVNPVVMNGSSYTLPQAPGYSAELLPESIHSFRWPGGPAWSGAKP